ncbi:MAG TPA: FAD:protein FMN transferase [Planctomycetota bacterium]|nr:FAD:protein FMN transferase [Planctomycetota bacterium]
MWFAPSAPSVIACAVLLGGCGRGGVHEFGGPTMGSSYEVKFTGDVPLATVRAAVEAELAAFDLAFSNWRSDSEIARCNRHRSTAPFPASDRFCSVLQQALAVSAATGGAFDPTVKPLSDLYRAAKRDPAHRLDPADVAAVLPRVDYHLVEVRQGAVCKARPDVELDLDGIVAGACADAIAERLDALAVPAFYLQITGEVFCRGEKAPDVPWRIGVVDPESDRLGGDVPFTDVALRDRALCTSGDYRNAIVVDGRVVHHVFDPRTGRSAEHGVVSVSVIARSAAFADALGTAFMVLGDAEAVQLLPALQRPDAVSALFLLADGEGSLRKVEYAWPQ